MIRLQTLTKYAENNTVSNLSTSIFIGRNKCPELRFSWNLKTSSMRSRIPELEKARYSGPQSPPLSPRAALARFIP